jgi:predicted enzyme related to lactoylglutathione lyase
VERVVGIGGVSLRASDPHAFAAWYEEHLGVPREPEQAYAVFTERHAAHVWSAFADDTDYWPGGEAGDGDFVVPDLDAMLAQLREAGVAVDDNAHDLEGVGGFGWAVDPEGNRFELWAPAG